MALGDLMTASRFSQSTAAGSNNLDVLSANANHEEEDGERNVYNSDTVDNSNNARDFTEEASSSYTAMTTTTSMAYLPQTVVLCELRHDGFEDCMPAGPSDSGLVSKWRPKDRVSSLIPTLVLSLSNLQVKFYFLIEKSRLLSFLVLDVQECEYMVDGINTGSCTDSYAKWI